MKLLSSAFGNNPCGLSACYYFFVKGIFSIKYYKKSFEFEVIDVIEIKDMGKSSRKSGENNEITINIQRSTF